MRLAAEWTLLPGEGLQREVAVDIEGGEIRAVDRTAEGAVRLAGRVLLPGLVNAHSHAFQRALRGRTQTPDGAPGTFWGWREKMYALAGALGPDEVYEVSRFAFVEMLLAGTTSVGEFFYLVNDPAGRPYEDRTELARQVVRAAADAGIRLKLLLVAYARGGKDTPARGAQLRYVDPDLDAYFDRFEALARIADAGLAPHSVRALPLEWLRGIALRAGDRVVHAHVAEQRAEVDACLVEHRRRPLALLHDAGLVTSRFTAVHATHLEADEARTLGAADATACLCPTTERDLGDGLADVHALEHGGAHIALGTDGQTSASILEEARGVEMNERVRLERRNVLGSGDVAHAAIEWATREGARSLGLHVGALAPGRPADLVALDLEDPSLAGCADDPKALLASIAFSSDTRAVRDVWALGVRIVEDGRHISYEAARAGFEAAMKKIWR